MRLDVPALACRVFAVNLAVNRAPVNQRAGPCLEDLPLGNSAFCCYIACYGRRCYKLCASVGNCSPPAFGGNLSGNCQLGNRSSAVASGETLPVTMPLDGPRRPDLAAS